MHLPLILLIFMCKNCQDEADDVDDDVLHSKLISSCTVLYHKGTGWFPEEYSIHIVCQRARGAGIHCSAHTLSQVMLTHALTTCLSGFSVACETSKAFLFTEARVVLQYSAVLYNNTFCARRWGLIL